MAQLVDGCGIIEIRKREAARDIPNARPLFDVVIGNTGTVLRSGLTWDEAVNVSCVAIDAMQVLRESLGGR